MSTLKKIIEFLDRAGKGIDSWERNGEKIRIIAGLMFLIGSIMLVITGWFRFSIVLLGYIVFMFFFAYYSLIKGWRHSAGRFLLACTIFEGMLAVLLGIWLNHYSGIDKASFWIIFIHALLWIATSLLADDRVAELVNEILCCLGATLFTMLSYFTGVMPVNNWTTAHIQNLSEDEIIREVINPVLIELSDYVLRVLLVVIGISTMGVAIVKIKRYCRDFSANTQNE